MRSGVSSRGVTPRCCTIAVVSDLLTPTLPRPDRADPAYPRPAVLGGALAAGAIAAAGAIVCMALAVIGWLGTDGGSAPAAARIGLNAWSLTHGAPVQVDDTRLSLLPLGLTALALGLLIGAGQWVARTSKIQRVRDAAAGVAGLSVAYGACGVLFALVGRTDTSGADLIPAGIGATAVAVVGSTIGILGGSGLGVRWWRALPAEVRAVCVGSVAGLVALSTGAALLLAGSLIMHFDRAVSVTEGLAPGIVGGILLTLISVAFLPNAIVFAAAYCLGPGFSVGAGTVISPTGVEVGPLPMLPILAALPTSTPPAWVITIVAVPFAAGIVAGVVALRRPPARAFDLAALRGALAGAVGGVLVSVVALPTSGAAGPGRLSTVGPSALELAPMAVLTLALGGAVGAVVVAGWRAWRTHRSSSDPDESETAAAAELPAE